VALAAVQLLAPDAWGQGAILLAPGLALLGALVWLARYPGERMAAGIVVWVVGLAGLFVVKADYLRWADAANPLKYDSVLLSLDLALKISPFAIARFVAHSATAVWLCRACYVSADVAIVACYVTNVTDPGGRAPRFLGSIVLAFGIGCLGYLLLPACGRACAFPGFPFATPPAGWSLMRVAGDPNCAPSLHLTTAQLIFRFRAGGRTGRAWPCLFLPLTALATVVSGEHYVVDLLLAVPFALFCEMAAKRRWRVALASLAMALLPMLAIRMSV